MDGRASLSLVSAADPPAATAHFLRQICQKDGDLQGDDRGVAELRHVELRAGRLWAPSGMG